MNDDESIYIYNTFKWSIVKEITLLKDCYDEEEIHYFNIKKPAIPKGTLLKVKYRWHNFYGMFYRCEYNGETYDIKNSDCEAGPLEIGEFIGLLPYDKGKLWDPRVDNYVEINLKEYKRNKN